MRTIRLLGAFSLGGGLLVCGAREALAEGPAMASESRYFVVTNDGSRYEGELLESVVDGHVSLRLATGQILAFDAQDIASQGSLAFPPPFVVPAPPAPSPLPVARGYAPVGRPSLYLETAPHIYQGADAIPVHIMSSSEGDATLAEESASGWVTVCAIPCTSTVDPKSTYQLQTKPGLMVPSRPFRFPGDRGALDLTASVQSQLHNMGWGIGLLTAGPLVGLPGIFLLSGMFSNPQGEPGSTSTGVTVAGWAIIGASAAATIAGVVMLVMPARTTLTDSSGHRVASRARVRFTPTGLVF
jgi:hypothetical protein